MINFKKAFSLIELILVILLIGVVYAVLLDSYQTTDKAKALAPNTPSLWPKQNDTKMIVFDRCSKVAFVAKDGSKELVTFENTLDASALDTNYKKIAFEDVYLDGRLYDTCLQVKKNPNGTFAPMIIQMDNGYYKINLFEEDIELYPSLESLMSKNEHEKFYPYTKDAYYE